MTAAIVAMWTGAAIQDTLRSAAKMAKISGKAVYVKQTDKQINYKNTGVWVNVYRLEDKNNGAQYKVEPDGEVKMNLEVNEK